MSLIGNGFVAYARLHPDRPDVALRAFHRGAALFPLHASFRDAPAVYAVYAQSRGTLSLEDTLGEIEKALQFHKNSDYLRLHYHRLRGAP